MVETPAAVLLRTGWECFFSSSGLRLFLSFLTTFGCFTHGSSSTGEGHLSGEVLEKLASLSADLDLLKEQVCVSFVFLVFPICSVFVFVSFVFFTLELLHAVQLSKMAVLREMPNKLGKLERALAKKADQSSLDALVEVSSPL